jgi:RHS repeat-associated protein
MGKYAVRQEAENLYQMGMRYYDAVTARFLTKDPKWPDLWTPDKLNPYQYALNNPLSLADITGADTEIYLQIGFNERYADPIHRAFLQGRFQQREDLRRSLTEFADRHGWSQDRLRNVLDQELNSGAFDLSAFQKAMELYLDDPLDVHAVINNREAPGKFIGLPRWTVRVNGQERVIGFGQHLHISSEDMQEIYQEAERGSGVFQLSVQGFYRDEEGLDPTPWTSTADVSVFSALNREQGEAFYRRNGYTY